MADNTPSSSPDNFFQRVLTTVGIVAGVIILLLLLWYSIDVLLVGFAGVLLALLLRGTADRLRARLPLSENGALAVVILTLLIIGGMGGWLLFPAIAAQVDELIPRLSQADKQIRPFLQQYDWGRYLLNQSPTPQETLSAVEQLLSDGALSGVTNFFAGMGQIVVNFFIIMMIGLFFASNSTEYTARFLRLIPPAKRPRARQVLTEVAYTLEWWLLGRLASMSLIAILTTLGLWLLSVPFALTLGLLTGMLTFIPQIGPALAIILPALLALTVSPMTVVYVLLFYGIVQFVESYLITPLIQEQTIELLPALTILVQLLFGILMGLLGVALATPILAVVVVLIKMLYIEDVLGEQVRSYTTD